MGSLDTLDKKVTEAVNVLMEHADAVQVFVTLYEGGETHMIARGSGNWCARMHMARRWADREQACDRAEAVETMSEGD